MKKFIRSEFFIPFVLIVLTFITYINILPNKLFFDDEELIYKNVYVQDLKYFPLYFTSNMIAGAGKVSNMYRPILTFSFALDHLFWGNNPAGYHLTSIILHALNGILVFALTFRLFGKKLLAFLTSVLFIAHPIQSEAVTYASGRTDPLYTLFFLSSIILFLSSMQSSSYRWLKYLSAAILFILSLLSKEAALILPLILVMLFPASKHPDQIGVKEAVLTLPFFLISLVYIFLRMTYLNFVNSLNFYSGLNPAGYLAVYSANLSVRFYTFTRVFFEYLSLLIFPKELIIARSVPVIQNLINPWVFGFLVVNLSLLLTAFYFWRENKLFLFASIWFFTTLLPASGVVPINNIIAEHYLYLPSFAFFLVFSLLLYRIINCLKNRRYLIVGLFVIIISLFEIRVIQRTFDWRDPITFYNISLRQSPWNIPMRNNLAMAYADNGKLELAVSQYKEIIAVSDVYPNTHHNLATSYKELGMYKDAEEEYKKALKMDPHFYFSYYGLADLYKITGEKDKLEEVLKIINSLK